MTRSKAKQNTFKVVSVCMEGECQGVKMLANIRKEENGQYNFMNSKSYFSRSTQISSSATPPDTHKYAYTKKKCTSDRLVVEFKHI